MPLFSLARCRGGARLDLQGMRRCWSSAGPIPLGGPCPVPAPSSYRDPAPAEPGATASSCFPLREEPGARSPLPVSLQDFGCLKSLSPCSDSSKHPRPRFSLDSGTQGLLRTALCASCSPICLPQVSRSHFPKFQDFSVAFGARSSPLSSLHPQWKSKEIPGEGIPGSTSGRHLSLLGSLGTEPWKPWGH